MIGRHAYDVLTPERARRGDVVRSARVVDEAGGRALVHAVRAPTVIDAMAQTGELGDPAAALRCTQACEWFLDRVQTAGLRARVVSRFYLATDPAHAERSLRDQARVELGRAHDALGQSRFDALYDALAWHEAPRDARQRSLCRRAIVHLADHLRLR